MSCCQRERDGRSIDPGSPRARNRFVRPSGQPLSCDGVIRSGVAQAALCPPAKRYLELQGAGGYARLTRPCPRQ